MSRSNLDKPFYVDVGTSIVAVRCASNHDVILEYDHGRSPQSQPTIQMAKDICDRMNKEVEIHNRSGDCAKLRKALKSCLDFIMRLDRAFNPFMQNLLEDAVTTAEAALASPPRNCDAMSESVCATYFDALYDGNRDGVCMATTEREKNIHRYYCKYSDWLFATTKAKGDTK